MKKILAMAIVAILMIVTVQPVVMAESSGTIVTGKVKVVNIADACPPNLIGIGVNTNTLNFETLDSNEIINTYAKDLKLSITTSGFLPVCGMSAPTNVPISIELSKWIGSVSPNEMPADTTVVTGVPTDNKFPIGDTTLTFTLTVPKDSPSDVYSQTVTISAIY
jgi:hypothetical protein